MSGGIGTSSFTEHWVYYDRLKEDFDGRYANLHASIKNYMSYLPGINYSQSVENVKEMAIQERKKENLALKRIFGRSMSGINPEDLQVSELVECFNLFLNSAERFERNLALIRESNGQKNTTSFYDFYFTEAFNDPTTLALIEQEILKQPNCFTDLPSAAKVAINKLLPQIMEKGFKKLAEAKVESGIKNNVDKYQNAYEELVKAFEILNNSSNIYVQQISKIYGLDQVIADYSQQIRLTKDNKLDKRSINLKKKAVSKTYKQSAQRSGDFGEVIEEMITNLNAGMKKNFQGKDLRIDASLTAKRIGELGGATDVIASIKMPTEELAKLDEFDKNKSKISRVEKFTEFTNNLKQYKNSLIIHISSKNYALGKNFNGFKTTTMSAESLDYTLNTAGINIDNLVSMIVQLCDEAIGAEMGVKDRIENEIAQYFAYIFYDDVQTIGEQMTTKSQGLSIHVLDLNGVIVPLSVFLNFLANAMRSENVRSAVDVNIDLGRILYPEKNTPSTQQDWITQRNSALNKKGITVHFLSQVKSFFNF